MVEVKTDEIIYTKEQNSRSSSLKSKEMQDLMKSVKNSCGAAILYFLSIFESVFEEATNKLQNGQANLTASIEEVIQTVNDAKNKALDALNQKIESAIADCKGKTGDDLTKAQQVVTKLQGEYKLADTKFQSLLQSYSPVSQQDTDSVTAISQNNSMIFQIAGSVIGILQSILTALGKQAA